MSPNTMLAPGVQRLTVQKPEVKQQTDDWTASVEECVDKYAFAAETSNAEALEPRSLAEAQKQLDWPLWEKAIKEKLALLREAGTWEIVDRPVGVNVMGSMLWGQSGFSGRRKMLQGTLHVTKRVL